MITHIPYHEPLTHTRVTLPIGTGLLLYLSYAYPYRIAKPSKLNIFLWLLLDTILK